MFFFSGGGGLTATVQGSGVLWRFGHQAKDKTQTKKAKSVCHYYTDLTSEFKKQRLKPNLTSDTIQFCLKR